MGQTPSFLQKPAVSPTSTSDTLVPVTFAQKPNHTEMIKSWIAIATALFGLYASWKLVQMVNATLSKVQGSLEETREKKKKFLATTGRELPALDEFESKIFTDVVFPDQIATTFSEVGGLKQLKRAIYESIILPLQQPALFKQLHEKNNLLTVPNGILFYGPPGTGKTLIAKSIAKSAGCTFLNVRPSSLQNKWFGESQKLVRAVFSLATKLAPSIIFLDECDSFMKQRGGSMDHEASNSMKSQWLSECDGLLTNREFGKSITILACTNRPFDIDEAFLRRLPRTFFFDLPNLSERTAILKVLLSKHELEADVTERDIARLTDKYTGSDLKELCQVASLIPLHEIIKAGTKDDFERVMLGGPKTKRQRRKATNEPESSRPSAEEENSPTSAAAATSTSSVSAPPPAAIASPSLSPFTPNSASSSTTDAARVAHALSITTEAETKIAAALDKATRLKHELEQLNLTCSLAPTLQSTPRALRLADFRLALKQIRPTGCESLAKLRQFAVAHRSAALMAAQPEEKEDDSEEEEEEQGMEDAIGENHAHRRVSDAHSSAEEDDDDEIYG